MHTRNLTGLGRRVVMQAAFQLLAVVLIQILWKVIHHFFMTPPPPFKGLITSKSLKRSGAHNLVYIVCTSHKVILPLKHLIRGHILAPLNPSRCAESGFSMETCLLISCQRAKCQHASTSTTQAPCSFSLTPRTANTKAEASLGLPLLSYSFQTHHSTLSRHSTFCHHKLLSSSRSTSMPHL